MWWYQCKKMRGFLWTTMKKVSMSSLDRRCGPNRSMVHYIMMDVFCRVMQRRRMSIIFFYRMAVEYALIKKETRYITLVCVMLMKNLVSLPTRTYGNLLRTNS